VTQSQELAEYLRELPQYPAKISPKTAKASA
jgi:hypothetical protein